MLNFMSILFEKFKELKKMKIFMFFQVKQYL